MAGDGVENAIGDGCVSGIGADGRGDDCGGFVSLTPGFIRVVCGLGEKNGFNRFRVAIHSTLRPNR